MVQDYPPAYVLGYPIAYQLIHDPAYANYLPLVQAYGFQLCLKLGVDSPVRAARNSNSLAIFALGKSINYFTIGKIAHLTRI